MRIPQSQARGRTRLVLMALSLLLVAGPFFSMPGTAQDLDEAREAFTSGNEAYQNGNYREAVEHFQRANELIPNARLLLYIGQAYILLDEPTVALEYIEEFAASSSENAAEVAEILEDLRNARDRIFDQAQATVHHAHSLADPTDNAAASLPPVWGLVPVSFRSEPAGAEVFIDDPQLGSIGRTPLDTEVMPGNHYVYIQLPYHGQFRQQIQFVPLNGAPVPIIEATLRRENANVRLTLEPITARATFIGGDGDVVQLGQGVWEGSLPAGDVVFLVQHAGEERRIEYPLSGGETLQEITLCLDVDDPVCRGVVDEGLGTLVIRSQLAFAEVTVDGAHVGQGIGEHETVVTPGLHTVRVIQEGYQTVVDNVRLEGGERLTWSAPSRLEELSSSPVGGIALTSIGLAVVGTGAVFGIIASGTSDDFNACQASSTCTGDEASDFRDSAQTQALIADIGFGLGGALALTGLILILTSGPSESGNAASLPVDFAAGPNGDGWSFSLTFDNP